MLARPLASDASQTIQDIVLAGMAPFGATEVNPHVAEDHHGNESIFVEVGIGRSDRVVDHGTVDSLVGNLRHHLNRLGEQRHPYIRQTLAPGR